MKPADLPNLEILGMRVHGPTVDQALDLIEGWIGEPRVLCRTVIVTGFHGLWVGHQDAEYRHFLNDADLFCPDGIAPIWLSRLHGKPLKRRVTGAELLEAFLGRAQEKRLCSYFYGDSEATLVTLRAQINSRFPSAVIAGAFSPPFRALSDAEEAAHVEAINASNADVLWVGLGLPKQERWIARNRHRLNVPVAIGVGAAFRFVAGTVSRAPQWMGDAGFEWVWRFVAEPKKLWRRDIIDGPRFIVAALTDVARARARAAMQRRSAS